MEPVVYDFAINDCGTVAELSGRAAMRSCRRGYYAIWPPEWLRRTIRQLQPARPRRDCPIRRRLPHASAAGRLDRTAVRPPCFPAASEEQPAGASLKDLLEENGFDPELHEQIRADLRAGRIGLAQNRLPASADGRGRRARAT